MKYAFPPPTIPSVSVAGSELKFPVHRIYCVGRNYADHAREMGFEPQSEPPFFFTKPADAVVADGASIPYALATDNLHHEIELVVAIGKEGTNIERDAALEHVYGYAVGLDMTRRDLQFAARDKGRPWDVSKAFDQSAPIGAIKLASDIGHPSSGAIRLEVNGATRQNADLEQLLCSVPDLIVELSKLFALRPGDLLYTGTPAGVGPVKPGDELRGTIDGVGELTIFITAREDPVSLVTAP
ncbi:MAG TPA: fumarylacetoacetate hydrolase family protein [Polyangiaceae bacterium]|nr:fumarylacetoacetate hydrolase family protein [Polyangiaceae bacterium]